MNRELEAERVTEFYTGVDIPTDITKAESKLEGGSNDKVSRSLVDKVSRINNRAIKLISELVRFKARILDDVLRCKMFTVNYPLLIDHIMREAELI